jgi:AhpD family alkylhydroperoxidase
MNAPGLDAAALRALGRALRHPSALRGRHIGARLRELVTLHVSSVNGCPVCSAAHGLVARLAGVTPDAVMAARACAVSPEDFDARTELALRYAALRTRGREAAEPALVAAFERAFGPAERREVRAVTDLFTFNNRINNAWERWVPGAEARRRRLGLCGREAAAVRPPPARGERPPFGPARPA